MVVSDHDEDGGVQGDHPPGLARADADVRGDHPPGLGDFLVNGPARADVLVWIQVFPYENEYKFLRIIYIRS